MKTRPMLMSAPMVRAIMAGTKTQTRRVAKGVVARHTKTGEALANIDSAGPRVPCPYGQPQPMGGKRHKGGITPTWWKRPAIFMPAAASRITMEMTGVSVERLQEISETDALAEGIVPAGDGHGFQLADTTHYSGNPIDSYFSLWEHINGAGSVETNPWVWCIEFKRMEQPK